MKTENSFGYKMFKIVNLFFMIGIILVTVLPYVHIIAKALNEGSDTMLGGILFLPRKPTFENIDALIRDATIYKAFFITVTRVIIGCVLGLIVQFMAGYALTNNTLPCKRGITVFFIIPMFFTGGLIPQYVLYSRVGLLNNFWIYVLPALFVFYNVLVIKSYISSTIPSSLQEAARIDGMGEFKILWNIIFPLSTPILATVLLWIAVMHWNDWTYTLLYVTKPELYTLQYKLMQVIKESDRIQKLIMESAMRGESVNMGNLKTTPEALVSAQLLITTIPIIIIYPFMQKYFVQGIVLGSVKE